MKTSAELKLNSRYLGQDLAVARWKSALKRQAKSIGWLRRLVAWARLKRHQWQVLRWVRTLNAEGSHIDESLSFDGRFGGIVRVKAGQDLIIEREVTIWISQWPEAEPELILGTGTFIGRNTFIGVYVPVRIGKDVLVGAYSYIASSNHSFSRRDIPIAAQGFEGAPVVLEDGVWLGTHVVILPGVTIGRGAIVAAGAVVNRNIPPWEIWGGVPARFLKMRPE